ncbi:hypothetical protein HOK51_07265 [Candidatus Woesearchaeota archaeon]|jgi:hypothetical protein|nr:hypothetical protein [Candidatus Woesearchaeota archaeon]MBT6519621.1 hypothetical protein [Candidatus Woesearchaeota archaeon]MBT7367536.1 hypothetical protein [Candidatus Woesearchaeota archaeon]
MSQTLKEIDKDILEGIKKIHELVAKWSLITKKEFDDGQLSERYYYKTGTVRTEIEVELRSIYHDVMNIADIDKELMKMNEKIRRELE